MQRLVRILALSAVLATGADCASFGLKDYVCRYTYDVYTQCGTDGKPKGPSQQAVASGPTVSAPDPFLACANTVKTVQNVYPDRYHIICDWRLCVSLGPSAPPIQPQDLDGGSTDPDGVTCPVTSADLGSGGMPAGGLTTSCAGPGEACNAQSLCCDGYACQADGTCQ
jgi:hypothetical protein